MKRKIAALWGVFLLVLSLCPLGALALPEQETPNYKVAFYPYDCYHIQDEYGKRSGYGYEMMQGLSKYLQCTFSYVGYDKSAAECEEMLRAGELDLYTAARKTPEREAEFVFSTHPSITSYTCMNTKVGNTKIVAGDVSTYNGLRIGLLERHTYNGKILAYLEENNLNCTVVYYNSPTDLSNALVNDKVDAIVNSYIRIPEDEQTVENFGETPYYIMARKEDADLIRQIDYAFDCMNVETPNWRTKLYNEYYGSIDNNRELTAQEQALREQLAASGEVIRAVMNPDNRPYSWYEDGEAKGIAADIFRATAEKLHLDYEIIPVSTKAEFEQVLASGEADVWTDMDVCSEEEYLTRYKMTGAYMETTMSVLRARGNPEKVDRVVVDEAHVPMQEIIADRWPNAEILVVDSLEACKRKVLSGEADVALMMSYAAQRIARDDVQNRLRVDIVPGATMSLYMGVKATTSCHFYGLWEKTLAKVANEIGSEVVQSYLDETVTPTFMEYLFGHPTIMIAMCAVAAFALAMIPLYIQSVRSKNKQERVSQELSIALDKAEQATKAKQDFFSKMSHDIRTPLNVVLGMTQIAQKYKNDAPKLENALNNITQEGNYLLVMINSILDVNQLEHGTVELSEEPFNPAACLRECAEILSPLSGKKEQTVTVHCDCETNVVRGDVNRLKQILINIVSNAIKYTGMGGKIDLRLECLPDNRYRFTCADNGIGMDPKFVQHICEDYARAEDSRVSKTQGTGLGMSVVKGFTDLMGGKLTIQSELGKGSVFSVELPFREASQEEKQSVLRPPVQEDRKPGYVGKKVLLVEDNALNAEIAMELLHTIGLTVDWAENGEVGMERYEASHEDEYFAVFMDMQMPVMDGVTATKRIRASKRNDHDIPIFAMTANTFASDRRSCREAGMTGYIPKPVSVKDIETVLTEIEPE